MTRPHTSKLALRSQRVLLSSTRDPEPATIHIEGGKIAYIDRGAAALPSIPLLDLGNLLLMSGIVETHAHINEPGRTEWEGFETATRAAAAGGITTVIDMPLNSIPPTTSVKAWEEKARAAAGHCTIDHGFWGGLVPGNLGELELLLDRGVCGFKAFLIDSGVDEFPMASEADLREGMRVLARRKVPLLVHAELDIGAPADASSPRCYSRYLASRPPAWEIAAARMMVRLVRETGCAVHIVHLSAADALEELRSPRKEGLPITVETCPHYLSLSAEEIADGATHFKCAPPIREKQNRERLWKGLTEGEIAMIVSDHSPCTPQLKHLQEGDFTQAWGGIAGLQFSLPVVWTEMRSRGIALRHLTRWMSAEPARLAGIAARKGGLLPGHDADLVAWDPEASFVLTPAAIHHRHNLTPYAGKKFFGVVRKTFLRGKCIYEDDGFPGEPSGQQIMREGRG